MTRIPWLLIAVLGSATYMYSQETSQATTMTGMLCNSTCVTQSSGHPACDQKCADKSGEIVLIGDQGQIIKIVNQEKVQENVGKKVKMSCRKVPGKKDTMYVDTVSLYGGGG